MDASTGLIVHSELVDKATEDCSSSMLETVGCDRALRYVKEQLPMKLLATDRNQSIAKLMRQSYPEIEHQYDPWHISKSITKRIHNASKTKGNEILDLWLRSIINHLWWSASSCNGEEDLLCEKWISILNHITNKHSWSTGTKFHSCEHSDLHEREKPWILSDSNAFETLKNIVTDKKLLSDIKKTSRFVHTSYLESFHNVILKYAPKRLYFPPPTMRMRLQLAVIDHNMGINREKEDITLKSETVWRKSTKRFKERLVHSQKSHEWRKALLFDIILHKIRV